MDYGSTPVSAYTSAIAYVKEGGAAFYAAGTDLSQNLDVPTYRFNYLAENGYALCVVEASTGSVLYISNVYNAEYTEIDYDSPQPTAALDYNGYTLLSQDEVRQKADAALGAKYAHFAEAAFSSVTCRYFGEGEGAPIFGDCYYDVTYFDADGRMQFECSVNGYTGKILYLYGNLPGEGNG